jgi:hypothetical protein
MRREISRLDGEVRIRMATKFKVGDRVTWNSEAGHVSGRIIKIHKKDVDYKGYTHHATVDDPQYEIKSDKTEHVALHKGSALKPKD